MNLENNTAFVLKYGAIIGVIIVAIGVLAHIADLSYYEMIMTAGITIIVLTPFAGVLVSMVTLSVNKEKHAHAAFALAAIIIAGMFIALWLR
jgi:uncharacterized membrane protein